MGRGIGHNLLRTIGGEYKILLSTCSFSKVRVLLFPTYTAAPQIPGKLANGFGGGGLEGVRISCLMHVLKWHSDVVHIGFDFD